MIRRDEFSSASPHFLPNRARPKLSVIVPLYDEEAIVPILVDRLTRVLDHLGEPAEVILVDDGSRDETFEAISRANTSDPRFVGLALSRNFGHQLAISAGLAHARGRAVVVMDGDLQDPPEAIGPLWARLREGYDVVYATRASRPEGLPKRLAYAAFYRLLNRLVTVDIPIDAGDFGIMTRRVVDHLNAMPERRRFLRGLRAWVGFRQTGLAIDRGVRLSGRPKFTLAKLVELALDGLIGFSEPPLRMAGGLGLIALLGAMLALVLGIAMALVGPQAMPGWFWISVLVVFFGGAQLLSSAVQGEYLGRILQEVHGRPLYVVRRRIGVAPPRKRRRAAVERDR